MPHNVQYRHDDVPLPMTEASSSPSVADSVSESDIRQLVDTFYSSVRDDAVLGPIFDRHVTNWSVHLPKMYDFWSTIVLRTGRYSGRPIEVHERLQPALTPPMFDRWLTLWERSVERVIGGPARARFIDSARRMARTMAASPAAT